MPTTISFVGAKGGTGTSTVAAATALLASQEQRVQLEAQDWREMAALLGVPGGAQPVAPNLWLGPLGTMRHDVEALTIRDLGVLDSHPDTTYRGDTYIVLRGPDYLGLRRAVESLPNIATPKGLILVAEKDRSLSVSDVEAALMNVPVVAAVAVDALVARTIDAGLLTCSMHKLRQFETLRALA